MKSEIFNVKIKSATYNRVGEKFNVQFYIRAESFEKALDTAMEWKEKFHKIADDFLVIEGVEKL